MKYFLCSIVIVMFFFSCNNIQTEFYKNGRLKAEYYLQDGVLHGDYFQYDMEGKLIAHHIYTKGKRSDSSIYYSENKIKYIDYYHDERVYYQKHFYPNGKIKKEGNLLKAGFPIGNWRYYNTEGNLMEIKELKNIQEEPYLNRHWYFDGNGDTLKNKGFYYDLSLVADTISIDEPVVGIVDLTNPVHKDQRVTIKVIVPKDYSINFNNDFSNIQMVEKDTTYNLNIEKDYKDQAGLSGNYERSVIFGRYYDTPGIKSFRGIIIEYPHHDENLTSSLEYFEYIYYFDKKIYVKDTVF